MKTTIEASPSFSYLHVDLDPGETITAESDAMASMSADLDMTARLNGSLMSALMRKFLGGETLFISRFTNKTDGVRRVTLVQPTPGDLRELELDPSGQRSFCFQPGAYLASTPGVKLAVRWAGFASWFAREGLFKLQVKGKGRVFYGCYGAMQDKQLDGEYIVDTGHLVAYEPGIKLHVQLAGGIFSSFFGGEGFVTRLEGKGKVVLQTRSLSGFASWLNPKLRF